MISSAQPGRAPTEIEFRDAKLRPIAAKVEEGTRLSNEDGLVLFETSDLLGLGALADFANRRANGDRVFFSANQHLNPTNVCILRKTCTFCSFARVPKHSTGLRFYRYLNPAGRDRLLI